MCDAFKLPAYNSSALVESEQSEQSEENWLHRTFVGTPCTMAI